MKNAVNNAVKDLQNQARQSHLISGSGLRKNPAKKVMPQNKITQQSVEVMQGMEKHLKS